jgi:hypothetical protein
MNRARKESVMADPKQSQSAQAEAEAQTNGNDESPEVTEEQRAEAAKSSRISTLAAATKDIMDTDVVRPSQFRNYEEILEADDELRELIESADQEMLTNGVQRNPAFPREFSDPVRKKLEEHQIPPSHVWVKGLVASYLATQREEELLGSK